MTNSVFAKWSLLMKLQDKIKQYLTLIILVGEMERTHTTALLNLIT